MNSTIKKSLGVIIWIFCTLTAIIYAVIGALAVIHVSSLRGPGAPLEGAVGLIGFGVCAVCIVALVFCWKFAPTKESLTWRNVSAGLAIYGCVVAIFWILPQAIGGYSLTVQFLDSAGNPMKSVPIRYEAHSMGRGPASNATPAKGTASTDVHGRLTIRTNRQHRISGHVKMEGFRVTSFHVDPEYARGSHQYSISREPADPRSRERSQTANGLLPAAEDVLITIYLASNQEGDAVPLTKNLNNVP